jgi:uncharacterized protein involved in exopolysaccharide biosynthesis
MESLNLKSYINVLKAKKKLIFGGTFFCMLFAALVSVFLPNIYQAKASVYIFSPLAGTDFMPAGVSVDISPAGRSESRELTGFRGFLEWGRGVSINVLKDLAKSPETLQQLKDRFKPRLGKILPEDMGKKMLKAEVLEEHPQISSREYLPMLTLTVEAKDKKLAKDLANAWAEIVTAKGNEIASYRFKETYESILKELAIYKAELLNKEKILKDFQMLSKITLLEIELKAKERELLSYNSELSKIKISSEGKTVARVELKSTDRNKEYLSGLLEKTKEEIANIQAVLYDKKSTLSQLQRAVETAKMDYDLLEQKKIQFMLSKTERPSVAKIIAAAVEPQKHIQPKRSLIIILSGIFGLILMCPAVIFKKSQ